MKKIKPLIFTLIIVLTISGVVYASANFQEKVWVELQLPLGFTAELYAYLPITFGNFEIYEIDALPILGTILVNKENTDYLVSFNTVTFEKIMIYGTDIQTNKEEVIDIKSFAEYIYRLDDAVFNYYGTEMTPLMGKIKVKVKKSDAESLKEFAENNFKKLGITYQNPFTGLLQYEFITYTNTDELKEKVKLFNSLVNENIKNDEILFLKEHPELTEKVYEITRECKNDDEKAWAIFKWVQENTRFKEIDHMSKEEMEQTLNVNYIWENREGNCRSQAYLTRVMLNTLNIKSKNLGVFYDATQNLGKVEDPLKLKNLSPHMLTSYYSDTKKEWVYLDQNGSYYIPQKIDLDMLINLMNDK